MKIRIRDLAKVAGVSPATVSNALNSRAGVSPQTQLSIRKLAQEMGYHHEGSNGKRKSIRFVIFKCHGLVVMDTPFFSELIEGVEHECYANGMDLMISHIRKNQDPDYKERIQSIVSQSDDPILLLATEMQKSDLDLFRSTKAPILLLDSYFKHEPFDCVVMNNTEAGYLATKHLIDAGHKSIGLITSSLPFNNMDFRRLGYLDALSEAGLLSGEDLIWRVRPTVDGAYEDMDKLLSSGTKPAPAFFATNDIIAAGCVRALKKAGYAIPRDISIIGMDDLPICQVSSPPLSTIRVFKDEMGRAAVNRLVQIASKDASGYTQKTEIDVKLIERASVERRI